MSNRKWCYEHSIQKLQSVFLKALNVGAVQNEDQNTELEVSDRQTHAPNHEELLITISLNGMDYKEKASFCFPYVIK